MRFHWTLGVGHVYSWASKTSHPSIHQSSANEEPEASATPRDPSTHPTESLGATRDGDDNDPSHDPDDPEDNDWESTHDTESDEGWNSSDDENAAALGDVVKDPLATEEQDFYE